MFPFPSRPTWLRTRHGFSLPLAGTFAGLTLSALSSGLPAASAQAASPARCEAKTLSQPFLRWGDSNLYSLVAGGDFESQGPGWALSGGARRVAGSEPYAVTGTLGALSLALPANASAESPFTCIEPNDRTLRFIARSETSASSVLVSVVYETSLGNVTIPVGKAALTGNWAPVAAFHTGVLVGALLSEGSIHVALRFTALSGASRIDDVFIDPRMRH